MHMKSGMTSLCLLLIMGCAQEEAAMQGSEPHNKRSLQGQVLSASAKAEQGSTDQESTVQHGSATTRETLGDMGEVFVDEQDEETIHDQSDTDVVDDAKQSPPLPFICSSSAQILKSRESYQFIWQIPEGLSEFQVALSSDNPNLLGEVVIDDIGKASYLSPGSISQETNITLKGTLEDGSEADCHLKLQADEDLGVKDNGLINGVVGNVYQLPENTYYLPDFSLMQPVTSIVSTNLDVPERVFSSGFPGLPYLFEWFGISYKGIIKIPADGEYTFKLISDDGAIFYLNGQKVIDNDGVHAISERTVTLSLTAGDMSFTVDYFQGPRYYIALQLMWMVPESSEFTVIAKEYLGRPKP